MSDWITDRKPTEEDGILVYSYEGKPWHYTHIDIGQAWKPIPKIEPYVKPKRYIVRPFCDTGDYDVFYVDLLRVAMSIPTREAAERIAAIYEEAMP
jgi:hypothetical protein